MNIQENREKKRQWLKMGLIALVPAAVAGKAAAATATDSLLAILSSSVQKLEEIAKGNKEGLYKAGEAPGVVGRPAAPGCIGEVINGEMSPTISIPAGTFLGIAAITLPPGLWQVSAGATAYAPQKALDELLVELSDKSGVPEHPTRRGRVGGASIDSAITAPLSSFLQVNEKTKFYLNLRGQTSAREIVWSPGSSYFYAIRVG